MVKKIRKKVSEAGVGSRRVAATTFTIRDSAASLVAETADLADLFSQHRFPELEERARKLLEHYPSWGQGWNILGACYGMQRKNKPAMEAFNMLLRLSPNDADAYHNLGLIFKDLRKLDDAIASYRRAIALRPDFALAHINLGNALLDQGKLADAAEIHRAVLRQRPDHPEALNSLGIALMRQGKIREAIENYRRVVALKPNHAEAYNNLGMALKSQGNAADAIECYHKAIALRPNFAIACNNLGNALMEQGNADAIDWYRSAVAAQADYVVAFDNLLLSLNYRPDISEEQLLQEHKNWDIRYGEGASDGHFVFANTRDPERPLRVGFVSADLRQHPVGIFLMNVFKEHDRQAFHFICYSEVRMEKEDPLTANLRSNADGWRMTSNVRDEELGLMIKNDGIDILVDLSGHTPGNRLKMFAKRQAPIQISWIGYFNTTGINAMDYIIMDHLTLPEGGERYFTEEVLFLPDGRFCYAPPEYAPEVNKLPARSKGCVTFGSFNNMAKMTPEVFTLWSDVLKAVPGSRLILKWRTLSEEEEKQRVYAAFSSRGIELSRIELRGQTPHREMLAEYGDIDVALDPFPFSGGLTSCEALWMGVPVITLPGNRPVSRQTFAFLSIMGLTEFVAEAGEQYVEIARGSVSDLDRLAGIRSRLREKMAGSPLCNGGRFARNLESLFRNAWKIWCDEHSGENT